MRALAAALAALLVLAPLSARADTGGTCIYQTTVTAPGSTTPTLPACTATRQLGTGRIAARLTAVASGTYTVTATGPTLGVGAYTECAIATNLTAASGTSPTWTTTVDVSIDGGTTWILAAASGANLTAAGTQLLPLGLAGGTNVPFGDTIRVRAVIGGTTPSFTGTVVALCK